MLGQNQTANFAIKMQTFLKNPSMQTAERLTSRVTRKLCCFCPPMPLRTKTVPDTEFQERVILILPQYIALQAAA